MLGSSDPDPELDDEGDTSLDIQDDGAPRETASAARACVRADEDGHVKYLGVVSARTQLIFGGRSCQPARY